MYVHPELAPVLADLPVRPDTYANVDAARAGFLAAMSQLPLRTEHVTITRVEIDGPDGNRVPLTIYRPASGPATDLPAVLHFHGGGFAFGRSRPGEDRTALAICENVGAVAIAVDYRLAPEHRYPAGVEDCYAALEWVAANADELGIDPTRIAVTGKSAGGGLSAAVALLARDRRGPAIAYQSLYIPLLDDRVDSASAVRITDPRMVNHDSIVAAYRHYLPEGSTTTPAYAAPMRATDLSGLPPAYVLVCGMDPLYDEGLDYARRLMAADVPVTVYNVPGAWHLFELAAPDSTPARAAHAHWMAHLRAALNPQD